MLWIKRDNLHCYHGDRARWQDIAATSPRPSPHHQPIIEGGEHTGWELDQAAWAAATTAEFQEAIEFHVDAVAQEKQYSGAVSCASYANSTNTQWEAEAAAFIAWRDAVYVYAFAELAKVQDGTREQPSVADFIDELPEIEWPDHQA